MKKYTKQIILQFLLEVDKDFVVQDKESWKSDLELDACQKFFTSQQSSIKILCMQTKKLKKKLIDPDLLNKIPFRKTYGYSHAPQFYIDEGTKRELVYLARNNEELMIAKNPHEDKEAQQFIKRGFEFLGAIGGDGGVIWTLCRSFSL